MNRITLEKREQLGNWLRDTEDRDGNAHRFVPSFPGKKGRPKEGTWRVLHSEREIPGGFRYLIRRSDGKEAFCYLEDGSKGTDTTISEGPVSDGVEHVDMVPLQNGTMVRRADLLIMEAEERVRQSYALSEASAKTVEMAQRTIEALETASELTKAATDGMRDQAVESAKAEFYKNAGYTLNRLVDIGEMLVYRRLPASNTEEFGHYQQLRAVLKKDGIEIKDVKPSDVALLLDLLADGETRDLFEELRKRVVARYTKSFLDAQGEDEKS